MVAQVKGFTVAGKTGTAQKINPNGIGYSNEKYWSSFIGMLPAQSPRLVILVMVDEPQKKYYGVRMLQHRPSRGSRTSR